MRWSEVCVHTTREGSEIVGALIQEIGTKGMWFEETNDDVVVKSYLSELDNLETYLGKLRDELNSLQGIGSLTVTVREVDEESWADEWKKYYEPTRITDQFTIRPLWTEYIPLTSGEKVIHLDPGMAFGTGTHPTTILAIRLMEKYISPGMTLLDVGCGSGILSIVGAKLAGGQVIARDIDAVAVQKTKENVKVNGVEAHVKVERGDLLEGISKPCDCVVANILADVIVSMALNLPYVLKSGGIFICSGVIQEKENDVMDSFTEFQVLERITSDGWVAIAMKRC